MGHVLFPLLMLNLERENFLSVSEEVERCLLLQVERKRQAV